MERVQRFDALKVLSMLFVAASHYITHCVGDFNNFTLDSFSSWLDFTSLLGANLIFFVSINCFVMISGYFLITKLTYRWKSLLRLWTQVFFYSVVIALVVSLAGGEKFKYTSLFPVFTEQYWFFTTYVGLMLVAPFLSRLGTSLTKKEYAILLLALFVLDSRYLLGYYFSHENSIIHFVFLYMLGGFFHLFGNPFKRIKPQYLLLLVWGSIFILLLVNNIHQGVGYLGRPRSNGYNIFITVAFFLMAMESRFFDSKLMSYVGKLAPYCFATYLIHDHPVLRGHLWGFVHGLGVHHCYLLFDLGLALVILLSCCLIDYLRTKVFMFTNQHVFNRINKVKL